MKKQMKTAKEMFEDLGYEKVPKYCEEFIPYIHKYDDGIVIQFDLDARTVIKFYVNNNECCYITSRELKAINKQCEELGWLEEE